MPRFSIEHEFEEMELCGDGLMACGTAELVHDGDGQFYVDAIHIGGKRFTRNGYGSDKFFSSTNKDIFLMIAEKLENDTRVQLKFGEAMENGADGNPDRAFDERRDLEAAA